MNKKRNLIYVFADQWRNQSIGIHDSSVLTPNMDAFARDSIDMKDAVTTHPLCSPYRACLFTGTYPVEHGVYGNCMEGYPIELREDDNFLDLLHQEGYRTGYVGKWHLDQPELNFTSTPKSGAKGWDAYTPPGKKRHGIDYWHAYNADNDHLHPHYWEDTDKKIDIKVWSPIHETDKAIEFMEGCKDGPFALFLSWNPPHPPYGKVPEQLLAYYPEESIRHRPNYIGHDVLNHTGEDIRFNEEEMLENTREYLAAITGLDMEFGRLISYLKETGIYEDSVIVLTADHGDMMGSHGLIGKHVWYEESVSIPFILHAPDIGSGTRDIQFSTVNIMPTIFHAMNLEIPENTGKLDLYREIKEERIPENDASVIYCQVSRDIFIEAWKKKGINPEEAGWRAIRTRNFKLVFFRGYMPEDAPEILLYDRISDPYEMAPIKLDGKLNGNQDALELKSMLLDHLDQHDPSFASWIRELES